MKIKNKMSARLRKPLMLMASSLASVSLLGGCSNNSLAKVTPGVYPNVAASNAKISEEFASSAKTLTNTAFDYFRQIAQIPRKSEHLDAISAYITKFANDHSYAVTKDDAGNIAFDVPASKGCEDYKKIILQAHLDMVVASSDDYTSFDPLKDHIHLEEDEESFHSDGKTNIGADDGEGLCTLLAIASSDSSTCVHGPLRFLFTADEDIGLIGANAMDASLLDSDYLINVDASCVGEIVYAAAGAYLGQFDAEAPMQALPQGYSLIGAEVKGLKGGHSSLHANEKLLGSMKVMKELLKAVDTSTDAWVLSSLEGGEFSNAIPTKASVAFAVPSEKKDTVIQKVNESYKTLKDGYPNETGASFTCSENADLSSAQSFSAETSKKIYGLLSNLPDGTIDSNQDSQTSCNVSPVKAKDGKISMSALYRSLKNSELSKTKENFSSYAKEYGFAFSVGTDFPAWEQDKDDPFIDYYYDGFKTACGLEGVKSKCAGGLETSLFAKKKPGMKMLSIGADVEGEHVLTEKLYKKSFPAHVAALLSALKNINKL